MRLRSLAMVASANSGSTNGVHHSCLLYGSGKSSILSRHSSKELVWAIDSRSSTISPIRPYLAAKKRPAREPSARPRCLTANARVDRTHPPGCPLLPARTAPQPRLHLDRRAGGRHRDRRYYRRLQRRDRKSVAYGKSVDIGGRRII